MKKKILSIAAIIGLATVGYFTINPDSNSGNDLLSSNIEALGSIIVKIPCVKAEQTDHCIYPAQDADGNDYMADTPGMIYKDIPDAG